MIFLNILQKLQNSNLIQKLPKKKVNYLLQKHFQDKNRIHFLRSKLKYGKVLLQEQSILHAVFPIEEGIKYVIRTDLMYKV
jgi:hypothetical protein